LRSPPTMEFLQNVHIGDIIFDKTELIRIDDDASLEEFNNKLVQFNILSMPVWSKEKNQYLGFLDVFDLISFISFGTKYNQKPKDEKYFSHSMAIKLPEWSGTTVGELLRITQQATLNSDSSRDGHIYVFEPYELVTRLLKPFGTAKTHRVLVHQKDDHEIYHTYRVLSQTDLVRFFAKNMQNLNQTILNADIESLGLTKGGIHTIATSESALDGFRKMDILQDTNALALVDQEQKLVGNLSASDLRGITTETMSQLQAPIIDFLKSTCTNRPIKPVTCTSKTPLRDVIQLAVDNKIHRVWVVDSVNTPVGVVTLSDIIRVFFASPYYQEKPSELHISK